MTRWHPDQGALDLPVPPRPEPDYPALARAELMDALDAVKAAVDRPPWDYRGQRFWRVVFRQMSEWLEPGEAAAMCDEFYRELERVERLFPDNERAGK